MKTSEIRKTNLILIRSLLPKFDKSLTKEEEGEEEENE